MPRVAALTQMPTPKSQPTPAVTAIANTPYITTRKVALSTGAAPVLAPNAPKPAKVMTMTARTTGMTESAGAASAASSGSPRTVNPS